MSKRVKKSRKKAGGQSLAPRNPYHDHPLMRRGGVHGRTRKAERRQRKMALRGEWSVLSIGRGRSIAQAIPVFPAMRVSCLRSFTDKAALRK